MCVPVVFVVCFCYNSAHIDPSIGIIALEKKPKLNQRGHPAGKFSQLMSHSYFILLHVDLVQCVYEEENQNSKYLTFSDLISLTIYHV